MGTCFKKATGVFGDYSEQQLVDCGYQKNGANGCNGAYTYSYIKTIADEGLDLTAEATYPYKNTDPALTCPAVDHYNQGAKVSGSYYTYEGDEEWVCVALARRWLWQNAKLLLDPP